MITNLDLKEDFISTVVLRNLHELFERITKISDIKCWLDDPLPSNTNTYKITVLHMLKKHSEYIEKINQQPDEYLEFHYIFYNKDENECTFKYTSNMNIVHDIILCSYLHFIQYVPDFNNCVVISALKGLIFYKYNICIRRLNESAYSNPTLYEIAYSFPSTTWDIQYTYNKLKTILNDFSEFNLPKIMFMIPINDLLPRLPDFPFAVILAITLKKNSLLKFERTLQYNVNSMSNPMIYYPESLKLQFCVKWKIIILENNVYRYAPCFAEHRQMSIEMIKSMKGHDPDLTRILSMS